jgi:hypothetical protein
MVWGRGRLRPGAPVQMPKKRTPKKPKPGRPEERLKAEGDWEANLERILRAGAPRERKHKAPRVKGVLDDPGAGQ